MNCSEIAEYPLPPTVSAVTVHVPAPKPVITEPLMAHGPFSLSSTCVPELELTVSCVDVPTVMAIGRPGPHGPLGADTFALSAGRAASTLMACDTAPLGPPTAVLENCVVIT